MTRFFGEDSPVQPEGEWLRISSEMTYACDEMTGRDDMLVKICPDAGYDARDYDENGRPKKDARKHHGVTYLERGVIEIDADLVPKSVKIENIHPLKKSNRKLYPVMWGVMAHEAGHARQSMWLPGVRKRQQAGKLSDDEKNWTGAALLLEEPRIEHGQLEFRPQDRLWLQASGTALTLEEFREPYEKGNLNGKPAVSRAALLILGRVDAGSVDPCRQTTEIEDLARKVFAADFDKLRAIWREAIDVADDDERAMLDLGRRWYELTGDNGTDDGDKHGEGQSAAIAQALSDLIEQVSSLAKKAAEEASGQGAQKRRSDRLEKAMRDIGTEYERAKDAKDQALKVFSARPDPNSTAGRSHPVQGYRTPTSQEVSLSRVTRRALMAAYTPERAVKKAYVSIPPGKLVTSRARQAAAQRAMGLPVTVEPVRRKERRRVDVPPLKVAIVQDVSGSQASAAQAAASGAWSLAKATETIIDAQVAMVTFGDAVHAVIGPRDKVPRVPVLATPSGSHHLHEALAAIEGELNLMKGGAARLLVILTDGIHEQAQIAKRQYDLTRLVRAGVKVLWFVTDGRGNGMQYSPAVRGVRIFHEAMGKYDVIPKLINSEAVNTLKQSYGS